MPSPLIVSPAPGFKRYYREGSVLIDEGGVYWLVTGFHSHHSGLKIRPMTHEEIDRHKHIERTT